MANRVEGMRQPESMDIDTTELKGRTFRCIEGCGLCCLCQPELLPSELRLFSSDERLKQVISRSYIDPSRRAIAMYPRGGPCMLLKDRKCTAYGKRPHFCRIFPVHTHIMWRIQLTADMSCRGIWRREWGDRTGSYEDLEAYGLRELGTYPEVKLRSELLEAAEVYSEFRDIATESGIWKEPSTIRDRASELIREGYFSSVQGLGQILAASERSRESETDFESSLGTINREEARYAAISSAGELLDELLSIERLEDMPVYVSRKLDWNVFRYSGKSAVRLTLGDLGGASDGNVFEISPDRIGTDKSGMQTLTEFASITNRRDVFLGFVYYLTDDSDYAEDIETAYLENMAMTQLDLLIRSALVNPDMSANLDSDSIADGIVFIDMDMHDAPTIGSVI